MITRPHKAPFHCARGSVKLTACSNARRLEACSSDLYSSLKAPVHRERRICGAPAPASLERLPSDFRGAVGAGICCQG